MRSLVTIVTMVLGALGSNSATAQEPTSPASSAQGSILDKAVNQPGTNWLVYGASQRSKLGSTTGVPGNQVMRVEVSAKGVNALDVGAVSPIQKAIVAGDVILVAIYLRAPT